MKKNLLIGCLALKREKIIDPGFCFKNINFNER